jgi:hypothetical protein
MIQFRNASATHPVRQPQSPPGELCRRQQAEFISKGLRARDEIRLTGITHPAEAVHAELQRRLDARRKLVLG